MKKINILLLTLALIVGISLPGQAQQMDQNPVEVGVKGGLNFSNYLGDAFDDADYSTRGNVGIFFKYDINPYFAIQPEANVSWTGAEYNIQDYYDTSTEGTIAVKQTYIQIPVLAKLQLPTRSGFVPNVFAGPVVGFSINDKYDIDTDNGDVSGDLSGGLDAQTTQFGLEFGVGVDYGNITLDGRYHWGLTDAFDNVDAQNGVFMVSLGIGI